MRTQCPGCGVALEAVEGPLDPYGASSPACWAAYGEVMAREFSDLGHFASHRMGVDAYMAQHPSRSSRAAVQSVWVHLAALCLAIERDAPPAYVAKLMAKMTLPQREFEWLESPPHGRAITVGRLAASEGAVAHFEAVRAWGESVWESWSEHHHRIRELVDETQTASLPPDASLRARRTTGR